MSDPDFVLHIGEWLLGQYISNLGKQFFKYASEKTIKYIATLVGLESSHDIETQLERIVNSLEKQLLDYQNTQQ
jgi:hypothetical protein